MTEQCRAIVDTILEHGDLPIDGKTCLELRDELKWYKRFDAQGAARLVDRSRGTFFDLREINSSLIVHYKWLIKSLRRLFSLLPPSHHLHQRLSDFSARFFHLHEGGDKYRKLRKKVRSRLPSVPSPHHSHERIAFLEKLRSASRKLEINEEDSLDPSRTRLKIASIRHGQNSTARDTLMRIWIEDWKMADDSWIEDKDREIRRVDESILELRSESAIFTPAWRESVELCPIYEFFFLVLAHRFQRKLWDEYSRNDDFQGDDLKERDWKIWVGGALRIFEGVATIPGRLIGLMTVLSEERGRRIPAMLHELFNGLEDFTGRSFSAGNSNVFLRCLRENEEEEESCDDFQVMVIFLSYYRVNRVLIIYSSSAN